LRDKFPFEGIAVNLSVELLIRRFEEVSPPSKGGENIINYLIFNIKI